MKQRGKKGQVTLFIILGIIIVALILILFNAKIRNSITEIFIESKPVVKMQECVKDEVINTLKLIGKRGGSLEPVNAFLYKGEKIEYLCFTNEFYKTCTMQQPLLKQRIERQILDTIRPKLNLCYEELKQEFRDKGYSVQETRETTKINIFPETLQLQISGINIRKDDVGEKFDEIELNFKTKIYDFVMLTNSIVNWEARYGDSETLTFMLYYPELKVEKLKQSDGTKIYKLSKGNEEFNFAVRSLSWPSGYGGGYFIP